MNQARILESSNLAAELLSPDGTDNKLIVDVHAHYGRFQGIYFPKPEAAGMMEMMDRAGVRLSICSPHSALIEPRRGNPVIAEVAQRNPGRFLAYFTLNPNYPEQLVEDVATLERRPPVTVGIKLHPGGHKYPLSGKHYAPAFEFANANRFPVLTHTWGHNQLCGPEEVRKVAERYPDVPLLMGHSCFGEFDAAAELARDFPNLYLELTAAYRVSGIIEYMVEIAGSQKILFGSDLPWFDQNYGIGCVLFSHISDEERRDILYRNAEKLFGIESVDK